MRGGTKIFPSLSDPDECDARTKRNIKSSSDPRTPPGAISRPCFREYSVIFLERLSNGAGLQRGMEWLSECDS